MNWTDPGHIGEVYKRLAGKDDPHLPGGLAAHCAVCVTAEGEAYVSEVGVKKVEKKPAAMEARLSKVEELIAEGGPGRGYEE